ncbi:MAG: hypothetical protein GX361_01350 [Bacteroidales bacterium]|nr:hypothetical protein [Bacteroidales bacterium]
MQLSPEELDYLRRRVETAYGKKVENTADCRLLSDKMLSKLNVSLSYQTFRRVFGLIKSSGSFEESVLNSLSRFAGSSDIAALLAEHKQDIDASHKAMVMMYENIFKVDDAHSQKYWLLNDNLIKQAIKDTELMEKLVPVIMKYPAGRVHFLECHPLRDHINTDYRKFFIEYQKYKYNNEAQLFTHGYMGMGDYLSENFVGFKKHYEVIAATELTPAVHHVPAARKFGIPFLYALHTKDEGLFQATLADMEKVRPNYFPSAEWAICSFDYILLGHLILTDKYELFAHILHTSKRQVRDDVTPEKRQIYHREVWKLYDAFAEYHTGNISRAKEVLESFKLDKIDFGHEMYYELHFLSLYKNFVTEKDELKKINSRMKKLIAKTNFSYFNRFLNASILRNHTNNVVANRTKYATTHASTNE